MGSDESPLDCTDVRHCTADQMGGANLKSAGAYSLDDLLVLGRLQGIAQGRLALLLLINAEGLALLLAWLKKVLDELQGLLTLHCLAQWRPAVINMACHLAWQTCSWTNAVIEQAHKLQ